ncbi:MAG: hypothetical protein ACO1RT_02730 [Planctomycetaceae bacterium]
MNHAMLWMVGLFTASLCAVTAASENSPPTPRTTMVIVVGASGTPEYAEQFAAWADQWTKIGEKAGAQIVRIGTEAAGDHTDAQRLHDAITAMPQGEAASNQPHWLILIGHGTFQANVAKFNLHGPDVAAEQLAKWLTPLQHPLVIVNIASASGPFVNALSGERRIVVTATKSGSEQNFARFGAYLPKALADPASDLDHDDEVSLLEAVLKATNETGEFYASEGRIRTEHAILDDNGDRLGTPAEMLGAAIFGTPQDAPASSASTAAPPRWDGDVAAKTILVPAADAPQLSAEEVEERTRIEAELLSLRRKKASLPEDDYFAQLEKWMLKLAAIYEAAEKRANSGASSP